MLATFVNNISYNSDYLARRSSSNCHASDQAEQGEMVSLYIIVIIIFGVKHGGVVIIFFVIIFIFFFIFTANSPTRKPPRGRNQPYTYKEISEEKLAEKSEFKPVLGGERDMARDSWKGLKGVSINMDSRLWSGAIFGKGGGGKEIFRCSTNYAGYGHLMCSCKPGLPHSRFGGTYK